MNKLKTNINGGFPFDLDDLRWIADGIDDAFKGIGKLFGDTYIISGVQLVNVSGSLYDVTEGYVYLNGEVCKVEASTSSIDLVATPYLYLELESSYDATGLETFENSVQHDTYEKRLAKVTAYASAQVGLATYSFGTNTAEKLLNAMIEGYYHRFTERQSWNEGAATACSAGSNTIAVSHLTGNLFELDGTSFDTNIVRFSSASDDGSWFALKITNAPVVFAQTTALTNLIQTPGGKPFKFIANEVAMFIVSGGKFYLCNGTRVHDDWHQVGATGEPAYQNTWGSVTFAEVRFIAHPDDTVEIQGTCTNGAYDTNTDDLAFTLPVTTDGKTYRPTKILRFDRLNTEAFERAIVSILSNGQVQIRVEGKTAATVGVSLSGIRFSTK